MPISKSGENTVLVLLTIQLDVNREKASKLSIAINAENVKQLCFPQVFDNLSASKPKVIGMSSLTPSNSGLNQNVMVGAESIELVSNSDCNKHETDQNVEDAEVSNNKTSPKEGGSSGKQNAGMNGPHREKSELIVQAPCLELVNSGETVVHASNEAAGVLGCTKPVQPQLEYPTKGFPDDTKQYHASLVSIQPNGPGKRHISLKKAMNTRDIANFLGYYGPSKA
ncbi:unnamed protein product [Amaranthus hypochondriacus]